MNNKVMGRVKVGDVIQCPNQEPGTVITVLGILTEGDLRVSGNYGGHEYYTPCNKCRIKE